MEPARVSKQNLLLRQQIGSSRGEVRAAVELIRKLRVKLFADCADLDQIRGLLDQPFIAGFTTNPTLMRRAGVDDYERFARELLELAPDRPVSFEVFTDDFSEMSRQAVAISEWGANVFVKIPGLNRVGRSSMPIVRALAEAGIRLNVTALMTARQVEAAAEALAGGPGGYVSLFAGRIADTGRDPVPIVASAVEALRAHRQLELIWASPRELLNIFQADAAGCHVITATHDILAKLKLVGKDLDEYSRDTVEQFHEDADASGYTIGFDRGESAIEVAGGASTDG